jgi:hypothetical protein
VFGEKTISDSKIGNYLNSEFYHYLMIYKNVKSFGLPYHNWLDSPKWLILLIHLFDEINEEYDRYKKLKGFI